MFFFVPLHLDILTGREELLHRIIIPQITNLLLRLPSSKLDEAI